MQFRIFVAWKLEKKFLEPFSLLFTFFGDIDKWESQSFENKDSHKYFMKWSHLIFQDMLYHLRNIQHYDQTDFDKNYRGYATKLPIFIDFQNKLDLEENCLL